MAASLAPSVFVLRSAPLAMAAAPLAMYPVLRVISIHKSCGGTLIANGGGLLIFAPFTMADVCIAPLLSW